MKFKNKLLISIITIFVLFNIFVYINNFAANGILNTAKSKFSNLTAGLSSVSSNSTGVIIVNTIVRFFQVLGTGYIIIKFSWIGIKHFTTAASSPAEKAQEKGEIQRAAIQGVLILGGVTFLEILIKIVENL